MWTTWSTKLVKLCMFPVLCCSVIVCSYYIVLNFYFQLIPPISFIILLQEKIVPWVSIYASWEIWIAKLSQMILKLLIWTWAPLGSGDAQYCQKYQLTLSAHTKLYLKTSCLPYIQHLFNSIWALVWFFFQAPNHPKSPLIHPCQPRENCLLIACFTSCLN